MAQAAPRPTLITAVVVPLAISTVVIFAWLLGLWQPLDNWQANQRFRMATRAPTGDVVVVAVDAKTIEALGPWPLKRNVYANIVDALHSLGAARIALDVDLSDTSAPDRDTALADAIARAGNAVVLAGFDQKFPAGFGSEEETVSRPAAVFTGGAAIGSAGIRPDADGVVRTFELGDTLDGDTFASVPALLAGKPGAPDRSFRIDFGISADRIDRISAADLLQGAVDGATIAGKQVIVGPTAATLRDFYPVPVYGTMPAVVLTALAADTLIQKRALMPVGIGPIAIVLGLIGVMFAAMSERLPWTVTLAVLGGTAIFLEGAMLALQVFTPFVFGTAAADVMLAALAIAVILRESSVRGLLVFWTGRELGNARTLLGQVVADSFAGILIVDDRCRIEAASRSAAAILTGAIDTDLSGKWLTEIAPNELTAAAKMAMGSLEKNLWRRGEPGEIKLREADGRLRTLEYVATPSRLSAITPESTYVSDRYVCTLTLVDVTDRRDAETRLAYLANFDPVTGLANRRQLNSHLAKLLGGSGGNRAAVICLDLDRFKNVNDTLGHRVGDLLLQQVGVRAKGAIGPSDVVARLGGDEFAIVLADHGTEGEIAHFTQLLVDHIAQPYEVQGHRVIIGASAGVAFAWLGKTTQELMKNADTALYRAKAEGGNCYRMFEPAMDALLRARQALEVDCWDALERGEFQLYYQPQVELSDGHITGVEALLRWKHPTRGFISPVEFIPIAEDTGLIELLGAWVLKEACTEVASWPGTIKVAVNVSPVQFQRGDLVKAVRIALEESGLPPERLDLEITESLFITPNPMVNNSIDALRAMGLSFSLDDFGTGYSSLSYLRKFPVNKIKIDRSFVKDLPQDRDALAVIRAVGSLSQSLGIRMNAEGIEEEPQAHLLRMLGCTEGQGYLFGRPMPAADLRKLLPDPDAAPAPFARPEPYRAAAC